MTLSQEQKAFIEEVKNGKEDICVQATAGAGKTSTLLESLKYIPKFKKTAFFSFSNTIVTELKERVPIGIKVSTLHSYAYSILRSKHSKMFLNENKYSTKYLNNFYKEKTTRDKKVYKESYQCQDICNFVRMTLTPLESKKIEEVCDYYNIHWSKTLIERAITILQLKDPFNIDFTDMLYLPVRDNLVTEDFKFDYIFIDEAQDLNECQYQFIQMLRKKDSRVIVIGDSMQCIYGFSGSTVDIFNRFRDSSKYLTFNTSFRCPKNIVLEANRVNPDITYFQERKDEGVVRYGDISEIKQGDDCLVLSRTTKPLVGLFFKLLENNIGSTIIGKDLESGLLQLAKRCSGSVKDIIYDKLDNELLAVEKELEDRGVQNPRIHPSFLNIEEKVYIIRLILENCRPIELEEKIQKLFNTDSKIKLMTMHRSKGLEHDKVYIIQEYEREKLYPSKYAVKLHEKEQEVNLEFVAITRAKKELIYIII